METVRINVFLSAYMRILRCNINSSRSLQIEDPQLDNSTFGPSFQAECLSCIVYITEAE